MTLWGEWNRFQGHVLHIKLLKDMLTSLEFCPAESTDMQPLHAMKVSVSAITAVTDKKVLEDSVRSIAA